MPERLKQEVLKFLAITTTSSFSGSFIGAIYTLYLVSRGLNLFQAAAVNLIFHIAIPLLEVPTGAFADAFGRKKSYVLAEILWSVSFLFYALSHSFWQFAAAELIGAFAVTFASGCFDAHVWETILFHGQSIGLCEEEIGKINRSMWTYEVLVTRIVAAIGGFFGTKIFGLNPALPWIFAAGFGIVTAILAQALLEEPKKENAATFVEDFRRFLAKTVQAVKTCFSEPKLQKWSLVNLLLRYSWAPLFMFWPVLLQQKGKGLWIIGYVWILIEVAVGTGAVLGKILSKRFSDKALIRIGIMLGLAGFLMVVVRGELFLIISGIVLIELALSVTGFGYDMTLQELITGLGHGNPGTEENIRASILSFNSMTGAIGGAFSLLISGIIAQNFSIPAAWGVSLVTLTLILLLLRKN